MTLRRRDVLTTIAGSTMAVIARADVATRRSRPTTTAPCAVPADLHLAAQEDLIPGDTLDEKLTNLEELQFEGFEPRAGGLEARVEAINQALQNHNTIRVSGLCVPFTHSLISDDPENVRQAVTEIENVINLANLLNCPGVTLVPAFKQQTTKLTYEQARQQLITELGGLGDKAQEKGTRILLEPVNRTEATFLNRIGDAFNIAKQVSGVGVMADLWHMTSEEADDKAAIETADFYLRNMHIASRSTRKLPGSDGVVDNYVLAFEGLKNIGYRGFVCYECGNSAVTLEALEASADYLRCQWAKRTDRAWVEQFASSSPSYRDANFVLTSDQDIRLRELHVGPGEYNQTVINIDGTDEPWQGPVMDKSLTAGSHTLRAKCNFVNADKDARFTVLVEYE